VNVEGVVEYIPQLLQQFVLAQEIVMDALYLLFTWEWVFGPIPILNY